MSIEERIALLEEKVSQILKRIESRPYKPGWIDRVTGSFADCPEFDEVIRLGREFRKEMNAIEEPQ